MYLALASTAYVALSLAITLLAARRLERNGRVFLRNAFPDNIPAADSVNRLLTAAVLLFGAGYGIATAPKSPVEKIAMLAQTCSGIGWLLFLLGLLHLPLLFVLGRLRPRGPVPHSPWAESAPLGKVLE